MRLLLITDLDNTLVGDDRATRQLNAEIQRQRQQICLVYATGRSLQATAALMQERPLLVPNILVTGVGTGIYHCAPANTAPEQLATAAQLDSQWSQQLSGNWDRAAIAELMQGFPGFQPQAASEQNPWKLSYWLDPACPEAAEITQRLTALETALNERDLLAQIVFSSGQDLDILPRAANKGNAVAYLQHYLLQQQLAPAPVVCGDSGNDISLFEHSDLGIIVKNAQPELLSWHQRHRKQGHYLATSPFAWGILEGLQHFQLL